MLMRTRRRPKQDGSMNKLESAYADLLRARAVAGEIQWWAFEPIKLRLADRTFYTPDFGILLTSGEFEFHETKGFWEDDARCKIKVAAEQFHMFRFVALTRVAKKHGGGWKEEEF